MEFVQNSKCVISFGEAIFQPIIVLIDEKLMQIPFEDFPFLSRIMQGIYRIPSVNYLETRGGIEKEKDSFDIEKMFYICNPKGDIPDTEDRILPILRFGLYLSRSISEDGFIGEFPEFGKFSNLLQEKDIYFYVGHGSGERFVSSKSIHSFSSINSIIFLLGCSSVKMIFKNTKELKGITNDFLRSGSRLVMGSLWDITDKDVDLFTLDIFNTIKQNKGNEIEVADLINKARR